jgi:hypothetical protein
MMNWWLTMYLTTNKGNAQSFAKMKENKQAMGRCLETRRDSSKFKAHLEDRQLLAAEHRTYLAGQQDIDANIKSEEPTAAPSPGPAGVA